MAKRINYETKIQQKEYELNLLNEKISTVKMEIDTILKEKREFEISLIIERINKNNLDPIEVLSKI